MGKEEFDYRKKIRNRGILIVSLLCLALVSFTKATSILTERSKQQIIVSGTDAPTVVAQINRAYLDGYRVTSIVSQSVSSTIASDNRGMQYGGYHHHEEYGYIIAIMEK